MARASADRSVVVVTGVPLSGGRLQLGEHHLDDRRRAARVLPRGADPVVVDQTDRVGCAVYRRGGGLRERRRLEVVAVCGIALEAVPDRAQRAALRAKRERVGTRARRQRADDLLPQVVVRELAWQAVPGDRVEPPLQRLTTR